jgi:hypothetical protein
VSSQTWLHKRTSARVNGLNRRTVKILASPVATVIPGPALSDATPVHVSRLAALMTTVFHLAFASVVLIVESKPKWSMGQYAKAARPSINGLATVPKALESFELLRRSPNTK